MYAHCVHVLCNSVLHYVVVLLNCRLPLVQCKQKFSAMDMQYKENLREWISEHARKYKLANECKKH